MTRLEKLVSALPEALDGIIVTSEINQEYLTGFRYTDGYVIVTKKNSYVLADFRYIEAAKAQVKEGFEVVLLDSDRINVIKKIFSENGVVRVGVEDRELTVASCEKMKSEYPEISFSGIGVLIEDLREYKDEEEKELIVSAQRIAEAAFDHILGYISPERTEIDIALELEYFMRKNGAEKASFDIIAVSGSASSMPHGVPRPVKLEKGFLTMDFGAVYHGYLSDMTRTVCIGKADDEMKYIYDTVLRAQTESLGAICEGASCREVDKIARDIIYDAGFKGCFGHGLGHGVGMVIHESPSLSPNAKDKLLGVGHVVTCEPGIYIEGKYGVRIEDMVYIGKNGPENLTNCPKNLIEL